MFMPDQRCGGTVGALYDNRTAALSACQSRVCSRLCDKSELDGQHRCAHGFTSDWNGYWVNSVDINCGNISNSETNLVQ